MPRLLNNIVNLNSQLRTHGHSTDRNRPSTATTPSNAPHLPLHASSSTFHLPSEQHTHHPPPSNKDDGNVWSCHRCYATNRYTVQPGPHPLGTVRCLHCSHRPCEDCGIEGRVKYFVPIEEPLTVAINKGAENGGVGEEGSVPYGMICAVCGLSWRALETREETRGPRARKSGVFKRETAGEEKVGMESSETKEKTPWYKGKGKGVIRGALAKVPHLHLNANHNKSATTLVPLGDPKFPSRMQRAHSMVDLRHPLPPARPPPPPPPRMTVNDLLPPLPYLPPLQTGPRLFSRSSEETMLMPFTTPTTSPRKVAFDVSTPSATPKTPKTTQTLNREEVTSPRRRLTFFPSSSSSPHVNRVSPVRGTSIQFSGVRCHCGGVSRVDSWFCFRIDSAVVKEKPYESEEIRKVEKKKEVDPELLERGYGTPWIKTPKGKHEDPLRSHPVVGGNLL
ncbi:hypothetical protein M011DRAFT_480230 [Sporormia fimetaria CBS 119925]|uniref:Probable double zinc ribbon domain-containing protein n=1 Tax=Sporormia fimetaria CBS 119925 TaxID=1340428 RepID=A0A6A6V134_9PLEO|nr:hypothetical protein M011DRAFT_480230 [Sporormia fimetaria CBS 119925]